MSPRETLIKKTISNLNRLPEEKLREISDFSDFLVNRLKEENLIEGIHDHIKTSKTYKFLQEEQEIYTVEDLKEKEEEEIENLKQGG